MLRSHNLAELVREAKHKRRKVLAIYLTCGFPRHEWTVPLAKEIFAAGADFLELGMPFSDPLADGPTIQAASQRALEDGMTISDYFSTAAAISEHGPTVFMGYLNSVLTSGFLERAESARLCGLILPEWPVHSELLARFETLARRLNLPRVPFLAPTSSVSRIVQADALNAPFIYAVSVTGVTGARASLDQSVDDFMRHLKSKLATPFLAGFGVSTPDAALRIACHTDGVIVGSALLDGIGKAADLGEALNFTRLFVASLRAALDTVSAP